MSATNQIYTSVKVFAGIQLGTTVAAAHLECMVKGKWLAEDTILLLYS